MSFAPNPCIGEISVAPFYAVKIVPGDIATYHGLVTDELTRVLDVDGKPIAGLFAVGNDAASIFGGSYPGAGATLGPGDDVWIYLREAPGRKCARRSSVEPRPVGFLHGLLGHVHRHGRRLLGDDAAQRREAVAFDLRLGIPQF